MSVSKEKRIIFKDTEKRHADLKIRLQHDDLTQTDFFRSVLTGYIYKDSRIVDYLYEWREKNKSYSKKKRSITEKLISDGRNLERKFGISNEELDNIFDLLEEEHPDL